MAQNEKKEKNINEKWMKKLVKSATCDTDVWAVLTALRGPDDGDDAYSLKWYSTARIRAIIGIPYNLYVDINDKPLTPEKVDIRNKALSHRSHFTDHFENAMHALKRMGYDVPEEELRGLENR